MDTKTKENKEEHNYDAWKTLVMGFVGKIMERMSDNVSLRIHQWSAQIKRRAIGSVVLVLGITYFLTGLATYADATLGKSIPGFGYMLIGLIISIMGYLVSRK